jgi:aspartyl-tRNA(Asn)/glutamyl-tRNA(Gln) amidotransferase subunit B
VRPVGQKEYGAKVEIKNLNSFRFLEQALTYEAERQIKAVEAGEMIVQETRGWDDMRGITVSQRSKEFAEDYRYFPEPDIPPVMVDAAWVAARRAELPELPDARQARFEADYGLTTQDAELLTSDRLVADYYEEAVTAARSVNGSAKDVANWIVGELFRLLKESNEPTSSLAERMPTTYIATVIDLVTRGTVTRTVAKQVFEESYQTGTPPQQIVSEKGLTQISDADTLTTLARDVIAKNPKPVGEYKKGKTSAIQFLVGQMMKATKGQANPQTARAALEAELESGE